VILKSEVINYSMFISSKHKKIRRMKEQYIRNIIDNELKREKRMKLKHLNVDKATEKICNIIGI